MLRVLCYLAPSRAGAGGGKSEAEAGSGTGKLVFLNVPTMQQPEAYIGGAAKLFDEHGNLTNDSTRRFLKNFIDAYAA